MCRRDWEAIKVTYAPSKQLKTAWAVFTGVPLPCYHLPSFSSLLPAFYSALHPRPCLVPAVINRNDMGNNHNKVENEINAIPWALLLQPGSGQVISYLPGEIFSRKCESMKNRTAQS